MAKILFVAYKYDYGKPELGLSAGYYIFYDTLKRMNNRKNKVVYFPIDEMVRKFGYTRMNQKLLEIAEREKPDICFFVLLQGFLEKETVKRITDNPEITTINWFTDDHWAFDRFSKHWAPFFNWVITTDLNSFSRYKNMGYGNVIRSQWAFNHFLYSCPNLPKVYDVSFVGMRHGNRGEIIKKLNQNGIKVECFGNGWPKGKVSLKEMNRIFSQTKINLNFSNSSVKISPRHISKVFLKRRVDKLIKIDNPKNWINNVKSLLAKNKKQIKERNFAVPASGSFLLTDYIEDLKEYYKIGKEIVCFKDIKDLVYKINYYLKHDEERESIARNGYERTIRDHTYENRFNEIFKEINI